MKMARIVHRFLILSITGVILTGCAGPQYTYRGVQEKYKPEVAVLESEQSRRSGKQVPAPPEYRIGMLDELEIRVRYHERYNDKVTVRPDGRITLVDIGDLYILGRTPAEIDRMVTQAYAAIVHDPEVTISVRNFAGLSVYIFGEVRNSGVFDFQPNMSILQALAMAGGSVRGAKLNSVVLLRRLETDRPEAIRLDISRGAIQAGRSHDLYLQPRDIIFVPRTFIASTVEFLDQVYDGFLPPIDVYIRALRTFDAIQSDNN
ncbi:MAG: polysaccharide biosynthesis/export family protein [bacterium]